MDTQNLKAFVQIADLGSFSAAAESLHLTQPAISKRIHNLEDMLNVRLLDRIGRQMVLTESGHCLLPNARRILQLIEESRQALDDLAGPVRGTLKLITSHHIGLHRLPAVLKAFRLQFPQVKLNIAFGNSWESHQGIQSGTAELGITTEETAASLQITSTRLWQDQLHFVVASNHPLAGQSNLTLEEIARYPAILPDARFTTGRIVRELFANAEIALEIDENLSTDYLETLKALVGIGEVWSVLPHTMLDDSNLAILQPAKGGMTRNLVTIRHKDRTMSRAASAFLECLQQYQD